MKIKFQQMISDMNIADESVMMKTPVDKMRLMLISNHKVRIALMSQLNNFL